MDEIRRPTLPPDPTGGRKLQMMVVTLGVVLAAMLGLMYYGQRPASDRGEQPMGEWEQTAPLQPPAPVQPAPPEEFEPPEEKRIRENVEFLSDPNILKDVTDSTDTVEVEAMYVLLARSRTLLPAKARELVNKAITPKELAAEPAKARGQVVYLEGRIARIGRTQLEANATEISEVWFVKLGDLSDLLNPRTYYLYLIEKPGAAQGEMVRVYAYFLKLWKHADKQGREETDPVLVGRELDPVDYGSDPWILKTVEDGTLKPDLRGLVYLCNQLRKTTPEELSKQVDANVTWEELQVDPEAYRGKPVRCGGALARLRRTKLEPDPLGLGTIYTGFILMDKGRAYTFYVLDKPVDLQERTYVAMDGLFLQLWRYETERGAEKMSPVVVGLGLKHVEPNISHLGGIAMVVLLVMFSVLAVLAIVEMRNTRQAGRERVQRQMQQAAEKLKRAADKPDEPAES